MSTTTEFIKKYTLPCLVTRDMVAFPGIPVSIEVTRAFSKRACEMAMKGDSIIFIVCQKDYAEKEVTSENIYPVGVTAKIKQMAKTSGGVTRIIAEPRERAYVSSFTMGRYPVAEVMEKSVTVADNGGVKGEALMRDLKNTLSDFSKYLPKFSKELWLVMNSLQTPGMLCDFVAANIVGDVQDKEKILSEFDPLRRLELTILILEQEKQILSEEDKIHRRVRENLDRNQRDFYLREQMKIIQEELGEDDSDDAGVYLTRLKKGDYPKEVREKLERDIQKLRRTPVGSADNTVLTNYIETCLDIPFGKKTDDILDIEKVQKILDEDHDGLEKVKERIVEYLSAVKLNPDMKNQIICLVGPPGTGKTSVAISIARALERKFVRVSLGGVRDEADIRGHRKTYVGAMPGRIITALTEAGCMNPLILFDEIDKMANDGRGDPASAMLEVLDGEQNKAFRDHFVEMPVDLSSCMFITTANTLDTVPAPLIDRMEIIELHSYTRSEKFSIAKNHLIPKQVKRHGMNGRMLKFDDEAIYRIIDEYTREAGVRTLEKQIAKCCRKAAKLIVEGSKSVRVKCANLTDFLGTQRMIKDKIFDEDEVGTVNGMAYTESGGELLRIETLAMPGTGKLELTGLLGDVMKESAQAAISYVRFNAGTLGIDEDFYKKYDIHIHFPEGAVPKDGPSAGAAIITSIVSELSGIPVRRDVAMTGEITLHGRVTAIGGLREKTMAAYLAGVQTIIIPKDNVTDLSEVADEVKTHVKIIPVSNVSEVLSIALARPAVAAKTEAHHIDGARASARK